MSILWHRYRHGGTTCSVTWLVRAATCSFTPMNSASRSKPSFTVTVHCWWASKRSTCETCLHEGGGMARHALQQNNCAQYQSHKVYASTSGRCRLYFGAILSLAWKQNLKILMPAGILLELLCNKAVCTHCFNFNILWRLWTNTQLFLEVAGNISNNII